MGELHDGLENYIKINKPKDNIYILIVIVCALAVIAFFVHKRTPHNNDNSSSLQLKPTTTYIDKSGKEHAEIKQEVVGKDEFERITDSFKRELKGRTKLQQVTVYVNRIDTVLKSDTMYVDTSGAYYAQFKDNYIDISNTGNYKTKQSTFSLIDIDTLTFIDYTKKHLFKANERIINLSGKSPYHHIIEGSSITLKEPKEVLSISMQVGYNPFSQKPYFGIGISKSLLSIKTRK